jgi:hypothetical protein
VHGRKIWKIAVEIGEGLRKMERSPAEIRAGHFLSGGDFKRDFQPSFVGNRMQAM